MPENPSASREPKPEKYGALVVIEPPKRGRPSTYSDVVAQLILDAVAESNLSLRTLCRTREDFPSRSTLGRWFRERPEFHAAYIQTSLGRIDDLNWECIEIADDGDRDMSLSSDGEGLPSVVIDKEHLVRTQIRLNERHRLIAELPPKSAEPKAPAPAGETPKKPGEIKVTEIPVTYEERPIYSAMQAVREEMEKRRASLPHPSKP